jgi:nitroreductase
MDIIEALLTRRSVRSFTDEPVTEEQIKQLLRAAMQAPSAGNQQPWHFVIITERHLLNRIALINPHADMCRLAPVSILICGDERLEKHPGYWVEDCSAAAENLLLAAHGMGLGAVWTGIHPVAERVAGFRSLFDLPSSIHPLGLMVVGVPAERPVPVDRYKEDRVQWNHWAG